MDRMPNEGLQEVLDRCRRRHEAEARRMTDEELVRAVPVARPFRQSVLIEEYRRRKDRPKRSVYDWLRHPAL